MTQNYNKKYLRKAKKVAKWLNRMPFVRCVILNGSVAKGRAKKRSDIDLLVIVKSGHIFTCRFFVVCLAVLFKLKRPRDEHKNHAGKFCLNYFMTDRHLTIPHNREDIVNKYCASNYSYSQFLAGDSRIFKHYIQCNKGWWSKYGYQVELTNYLPKTGRNFLRSFMELLIGSKIEKKLKNYQIAKIESDPITQHFPALICYSDQELRFHPPKDLG